ncbi:hypothetical protein HDU77_010500 [Chytriomyces hyalinus]|nr:hypothetical protein HDU77_010500 [Chytriomyces hyalinus]
MGCCQSTPIDFDAPVDITHFELCRSIGKGAFGKVRIVEHKKTRVQYALKYINKAEVAELGVANNMLRERKLLQECDNPFICNLRYAFQDDMHLLMVLDLKLGGDLEFHLRANGYFTEERSKFYFSEIACGVQYLHSLKIVHRDLKPGNVLLDEFGHASLTDFNIACHYDAQKPMTSRSGTLAYMAPEVINKAGYFNSIDWWSLGIMTFEMLYGYTPFAGDNDTETKFSIRNNDVEFPADPKSPVSDEAKDMILGLLNKNPTQRLGSDDNGGVVKLKHQAWFRGWDWEKAEDRELPVPFLPDPKNNMYYNSILELEEALFEDNPLQSKPVRIKTRDPIIRKTTKLTEEELVLSDKVKQMNMLNEGFADFDFTKFVADPHESLSMTISASMEGLVQKEAGG